MHSFSKRFTFSLILILLALIWTENKIFLLGILRLWVLSLCKYVLLWCFCLLELLSLCVDPCIRRLLPPLIRLASRLRELCQVKLHQILYQAVHLFLIIFQSLSIDNVLFLEVTEELSQVLQDLLINLFIYYFFVGRVVLLAPYVFSNVRNNQIFRVFHRVSKLGVATCRPSLWNDWGGMDLLNMLLLNVWTKAFGWKIMRML